MLTLKLHCTIDRVSVPKDKQNSGYVTITYHGGTSNMVYDLSVQEHLRRLEGGEGVVTLQLLSRNTVEFGRSESWFKPVKVVAVEVIKG